VKKEKILEFVRIYKQFYGVDISPEEAESLAQNLLNLFKTVYGFPLEDIHQQRRNINQN
jgi:uncharacterized protein (DUF697 family)